MRMSEGAGFKRAYRHGAENGIDRLPIFRQGRGQYLDHRPVAPLLDERVLREHRLAAAPRFIEQATQTNGMTPVFGRAQTTLAFTWPKKRGAGFRPIDQNVVAFAFHHPVNEDSLSRLARFRETYGGP